MLYIINKYIVMLINHVFETVNVQTLEKNAQTYCKRIISIINVFFEKEILAIESDLPYNIIASNVFSRFYYQLAKRSNTSTIEFIRQYAISTARTYVHLNAFGAFGDLIEILVRVGLKKSINLVKLHDIHVSEFGKVDITSKGLRLEVGHNGKTFKQALPNDYMFGDFDSVVYGVFNDMDKDIILDYILKNELMTAVRYVSDQMYIWTNKKDFLIDINRISRGKGIRFYKGDAQVIYNDSKYRAFIDYRFTVPTITEYVNQ